MEKQYLDYNGLANVAGYVNTRLKTVTTMPVSADNGAVRLYVGTTDSTYIQGHIYQYNTTQSKWIDITATTPLPVASSSVLGGVKVGSDLEIDANGVLTTNLGLVVNNNGQLCVRCLVEEP